MRPSLNQFQFSLQWSPTNDLSLPMHSSNTGISPETSSSMKVKLVTGAECECVQPELCTREGEMTAEERSFGKKPKTAENGGGEKEAISSDGGIRFTFSN